MPTDPLVEKVAEAIEDTQSPICWGSHEDYRNAQARNAIAVVRTHIAADIESVAPGFPAASEGGFEFGLKTAYVIAKGNDHA